MESMPSETFLGAALSAVYTYANDKLDATNETKLEITDIHPVWLCKVLQNYKGFFTTDLPDGMYYEVTYNGDDDVMYLDAYKKWENVVIVRNVDTE